ncbi:MAG: ribosome small subunit-dependent GTPase A [Thermoanaerobaculaceae bacterium]|nr:ribosome small subunit-dependent GTPase A [Thermoanaerobaculaceae bacterium]MDI9621536.1 ribosome small subunit-dependent GTPase A [Acidobacteriota bacterium]NLH11529.1 ribosome small subunit-dependent GTPase A [Holophagae bacterium]HPW55165.1 ribosome small subunit-dependent GTPase A [Thermoanaerobaculaceae bacterium]
MESSGAVVTAVYGPLVRVQVGDTALMVPFRRRLRWHGDPKDPRLVVGDRVVLEGTPPAVMISEVLPRRTTLTRRSPGENRLRVVAANVDRAVIVLAAAGPDPNPRLLDRFLVACHHAGIEPLVCVNKVDKGTQLVDEWLQDYAATGYQVLLVSARTARGMGSLKRAVSGHTTLFCGPSGVGKSALLNAIHPGYRLREGSISEATGKGRHTTSTAQLFALPGGGFVVDTPGVREFGFWDLTPQKLRQCFPDLAHHAHACVHSDCTHAVEDGCGVIAAVGRGELSARRLASYQAIHRELVGLG